MPFVVTEIPADYLPPDVSVSVTELQDTFFAEIWSFFGLLVPIVVMSLLLRSFIRNV